MLKAGDTAPDFDATIDGMPFRLSEAVTRQPVVLYFYPKDFTGGCTKQACSFRDNFEEITATGALLVGVSHDDHDTHARFRDRYQLPFPLVADPDKRIIDAYEARGPFGLGTARVTYVIDQAQVIRDVIRHDLLVSRHVPEVLAALKRLTGASNAAAS